MRRFGYLALFWAALLTLGLAGATGAGNGPAAVSQTASGPVSCLECHQGQTTLLGPHAELECGDCHQGVEAYPHQKPRSTPCRECHQPHGTELTADPHLGVSCQACHLAGLAPLRLSRGGPVGARPPAGSESTLAVHRLVQEPPPASCRRCHHPGNPVGAAAMVLPARGLACLACHTATPTLPDWPSRLGLAMFVLGLLGSLGFWFSGGGQGPAGGRPGRRPGGRLGPVLAALFLDGLLQRRLWRLSPARWLIHALIFLPFVARLAWGLAALLLETWAPTWPLTQALGNKNFPATALFFDISGLLVLAGVAAALLRRWLAGRGQVAGLPRPDWLAMALLAGIVLSGFVVEAARMAMTGWPAGSAYAFGGLALSQLFSPGPLLSQAYGYLWYAHAVIFAALLAYLPFSRMFHILLAPLSLALQAAGGHPRPPRGPGDSRS